MQAPLACTVPQQQRFVTDAPRRFDVNAGVWDNPFLAPIAKRIQGPVARSDDEREGVAGADAAMTTVPPAPLLAGSGLMASMNTPTIKFWMESCVGAGTVKMGLPGLAAQVPYIRSSPSSGRGVAHSTPQHTHKPPPLRTGAGARDAAVLPMAMACCSRVQRHIEATRPLLPPSRIPPTPEPRLSLLCRNGAWCMFPCGVILQVGVFLHFVC